MSADRRRPAQYVATRNERLKRWIADEVYPYSRLLRPILDKAGVGRSGISDADSLRKLPILDDAVIGDGRLAILEPNETTLTQFSPLPFRLRYRTAALFGKGPQYLHEHVDPVYRPVRWVIDHERFVASSSDDLNLLGELGRRALSAAGVVEADRVLAVSPLVEHVGMWQLQAGLRVAGVPLMQLTAPDAAVLSRTEATVLAGGVDDLRTAIAVGLPPQTRLLLVVDPRPVTAEDRAVLSAACKVVVWWAPRGARALWSECSGGEATGFHTFPTTEFIEVLDPAGAAAEAGRLVWSAVGWRGSVWLRYDTGASGSMTGAPCPACGRTVPRVLAAPVESA